MRSILLPALLVLAIGGCGGGDEPRREAAPPPAPRTEPPPPPPVEFGDGLAIGLHEVNAHLWRGDQAPPPLLDAAQKLATMKPSLARVVVDWAGTQPDPTRPADLGVTTDGCLRRSQPCVPFSGVEELMQALGASGTPAMVVFYGVPEWAAAKPKGCERPNIEPRSRPITDRGLAGYRRLVRQVHQLAADNGVDLRWYSVWNEPNGPFFISPQRERCSTASPPVSVKVYARLARALRAELDEIEGDQRVVVGELAGVAKAGPRGSGVGEFLRALDRDVLCGADVLAQHEYAELPEDDDDQAEPVPEVKRVLKERCPGREIPIWITETGIGGARAGDDRPTGSRSLRRQCEAYHRRLRAWYRDPQIQVAVQYTFREDSAFPVGVLDASLTRTYPTHRLLSAWAGTRQPGDPPPSTPCDG